MSRSLASKQLQLAAKAGELTFAAPQVMAERLTRMMFLAPAARDREMQGFGAEKARAAFDGWSAMGAQGLRSAQAAAVSYTQAWWKAWFSLWFPLLGRARFPAFGMTPGQVQHAALDMMGQGMAPMHRRVVANARGPKRAKRR